MTSRKALLPDSNLIELVADEPAGTVVGRFSVFDEIDGMGERTKAGCFDKAISQLTRNGIKLPLIYHHRTSDAQSLIGVVDEVWVDKKAAWFKARLDLSNPKAQRLYAIMQLNPTAMGVSYGFGMPSDGSGQKKAKDGATDLVEIYPLLEITLTPMPALDVARVEAVKSRGRSLSEAENLLLQFEVTAARGGFKSLDPVYVWDGLMSDPVFEFDALEANISAKAAVGQGQCAKCGQYLAEPPMKAPESYGYLHVKCPGCSAINFEWDDTKSLTRNQFNLEARRLTVYYKDRDRNAKMFAHLEKAQQKREVENLVRFVKTPARPSKSDVKAVIDTFDAVLKPSKKPTTTAVESLFGSAPPIRKDQLQ